MRDRLLLTHYAFRTAFVLGGIVLGILLLRAGWSLLAEIRFHVARRQLAGLAQAPAMTRPAPASPAATLVAVAETFRPLNFRPFGLFNNSNLPQSLDGPWTEEERKNIRDVLSANADLLRRLDAAIAPGNARAAPAPIAPWFTALDNPIPNVEATLLDRLRLLEDLCAVSSVVAHIEGHDDEALAHLERLFAIDRILLAHPSIAAHNLALIARARVVAVLERIAPELEFERPGVGAATRPASPAAAKRLIAALLDDTSFRAQLDQAAAFQVAALCGEPTPLDERPALLRPEQAGMTNWFLRPILVDERRRALDASTRWRAIIRSDSFELARQSPYFPTDFRLARVSTAASNTFSIQWARLTFGHFRALADARAAAVLLAARLAALDRGSPPATAESFVPALLPVAPIDPFAADGRPLRYDLGPLGVTVWSVGADGTDDGATVSRMFRGRNADQPDLVYGAGWRSSLAGAAIGPTTGPAATAPGVAP
jgi:hypothetical protein